MIPDPAEQHNSRDGSPAARRLLAPHPWPFRPGTGWADGPEDGGGLWYLSWPGWELYLARRWGWRPAGSGTPRPVLLPDVTDPERDYAAVDQLIQKAGEMGAGLLALFDRMPESLAEVRGALRQYTPREKAAPPAPILDDRSYLALWAATERQSLQGRELLAEAARRQSAMWAALKGEEPESAPAGPETAPPGNSAEPDRRAAYAWQCWRRLAAPLLRPSDIIVTNPLC